MLAAALLCGPAQAETLEQALADAYLVNPVLNAERARFRAIDEQVALAKSGLRPNIGGTADTNYVNQNSDRSGAGALDFGSGGLTTDGVTHPRGYALQLSQPLFEGFQNLNAIREAKAQVQSQREALRSVEQTVLLDAATAYVNLVRDQAIVRLRENDVSVLSEQLKATRDRFDVGEVTRTDTAQAEARRSEALATLGRGASQSENKPRRLRAGHRPSARQSANAPVDPPSPAADARRGHDARRRRESGHPRRPSIPRRPRFTRSSRSWASCCPR